MSSCMLRFESKLAFIKKRVVNMNFFISSQGNPCNFRFIGSLLGRFHAHHAIDFSELLRNSISQYPAKNQNRVLCFMK